MDQAYLTTHPTVPFVDKVIWVAQGYVAMLLSSGPGDVADVVSRARIWMRASVLKVELESVSLVGDLMGVSIGVFALDDLEHNTS